ncbi:cell division protein SepF [Kineosporia sp. A_224]|uniref:cell division protein SepF n=1 Tax=Kineosporia sp. A_224 TaxID=1962180 RepID=UPI000B4ACDC3|nr:cell division protein SepF [Kineosporia sp. A_224]
MGGALRKTMIYLGLAEDDERYEAYDADEEFDETYEDDDRSTRHDRAGAASERSVDRLDDVYEERRAAVTPIGRGQVARVVQAPARSSELHRISTIHPRTYNEAKTIGEAFRGGTPVIMNLGEMDDADAKRLVDFAAGLVFGLHGTIERVTSKVFLLSPASVEVTPADKIRNGTDRDLFTHA